MTESEWLASVDPRAMLEWLTAPAAPSSDRPRIYERHPSDRKLRLFACACAYEMGRKDARKMLAEAEAWADSGLEPDEVPQVVPAGFAWCYYPEAYYAASEWATSIATVSKAARAALLRDMVGNPFRPVDIYPATIPLEGGRRTRFVGSGDDERLLILPDWLTPLVESLAKGAYDERSPGGTLDPDRLAILGDALIDAGCEETVACDVCKGHGFFHRRGDYPHSCADECAAYPSVGRPCDGTGRVPNPLLAALREPGPKYRGLWVVDALLGKE